MSMPKIVSEEFLTSRRFIGRAEDLISAGLCKLEWMPGQPNRGKYGQTLAFNAGETITFLQGRESLAKNPERRQGLRWLRIRKERKGLFSVERPYLPSEEHLRPKEDEPTIQDMIDKDLLKDGIALGIALMDHVRYAKIARRLSEAVINIAGPIQD